MMWFCNLLVQLAGFGGFALLTVPAFHAAKYARLLAVAEAARPKRASVGQEAYRTALNELKGQRERWTAGKSFCLIAGTLLSVASYLLAAYLAYITPSS